MTEWSPTATRFPKCLTLSSDKLPRSVHGVLLWLLSMLVVITFGFAHPAAAQMPKGASDYQFTGWNGLPLKIHAYRPSEADQNTPIMIVMHGVNRDADRYRDEWIPVAEKLNLIVIAPEFDEARYPKSTNYNLGGLGVQDNSSPVSAFGAIEPLFDDVRQRAGSATDKYFLYGHSAGAQFVTRFVLAKPAARIRYAFAANAGWYTMLSSGIAFPYGLKDSGLPQRAAQNALAFHLVIMVGDADTQRDGSLRKTPEAEMQGYSRLQRGLIFFSHAATLARQKDMEFAWRLVVVPGSGHENAKMAWGVEPFVTSQLGAGSPAK